MCWYVEGENLFRNQTNVSFTRQLVLEESAMAPGSGGDSAKSCMLLQELETFLSLRLWFVVISLFGIVCVFNSYNYVGNIIQCGIRITSFKADVNFDTTTSRTITTTRVINILTRNTSKISWSKQKWEEFKQHDNDVLLEYDSVWKIKDECRNGSCSKVVLNGEIYIKELNETELALQQNRSKRN